MTEEKTQSRPVKGISVFDFFYNETHYSSGEIVNMLCTNPSPEKASEFVKRYGTILKGKRILNAESGNYVAGVMTANGYVVNLGRENDLDGETQTILRRCLNDIIFPQEE